MHDDDTENNLGNNEEQCESDLLPSNLQLFNEQNGVLIEENISPIFSYLLNKSNPSSIKLTFINKITNSITNNRLLSESFAVVDCYSIFVYLIDLFEQEQDNEELKQSIIDLIKLLIQNITVSKDVYERLFKYCRTYYNNKDISKEDIENCLLLTELFYPAKSETLEPKNYFAFYDPNNEGITVDDKQYEIILGTNFILSFKTLKFNTINNSNKQHTSNLVSINFTNEGINSISIDLLHKEDKVYLSLNPALFEINETEEISFEYNVYYVLTLIFHPGNKSLCVFVNDSTEYVEFPFKQKIFDFQSKDNKISQFVFFKKFYGEVTTIINFKKCLLRTRLWKKRLNEKMSMFTEGLWNKTYLQIFLGIVESGEILPNDTQNSYNRAFLIGEEIINFMFVPFNKDKPKILSDVFNRSHGIYKEGIHTHTFKKIYKNIENIGGSWNLIPLLEMICFYYIKNKNSNENDIELLIKYFTIVNNLIETKNEKNINELFASRFFEVAALFLAESKNTIKYNNDLINKIFSIGKIILSLYLNLKNPLYKLNNVHLQEHDKERLIQQILSPNKQENSNMQTETPLLLKENLINENNSNDEKIKLLSNYLKTFYTSFIFNEDILKHLSTSTLLFLLKNIEDGVTKFLKMTTIMYLVILINPINIFCCAKHKNEFKSEYVEHSKMVPLTEFEIIEEILSILIKIIKFKIQKYKTKKNFQKTTDIFHKILNILSYNLSPCFQVAFIKLIHGELTSDSRPFTWIIKALEAMMNYHISNIMSSILYQATIHVKKEIVKLLLTMYDFIFNPIQNKNQTVPNQLKTQFNAFLYSIKHCYLLDETFLFDKKVLAPSKDKISEIAKHCVSQIKSQQKKPTLCSSETTLIIREDIYNQYIKFLYNEFSLLIFNSDDDDEEDKGKNNTKLYNHNIFLSLIVLTTKANQPSLIIDFLNKISFQFSFEKEFKDHYALLNSKMFLRFLFDLSFQYSSESNTNISNATSEQSTQIYNLSRQIYLNLLIDAIQYLHTNLPKNKNNIYYPIDSLETLLKWGNMIMTQFNYRQELVFGFISKYLEEISNKFISIIDNDKFPVSDIKKKNFIHDNYYRLINFSFYYYAHYKLDSGIIKNGIIFLRSGKDTLFKQNNLITGIKFYFPDDMSTVSITNIWHDYRIFKSFYDKLKKIWSDKEIVDKFYKDNSTNAIKNIVKKYCISKKEADSRLGEILIICNVKNNMYGVGGSKMSLLIILMNTLPMILIMVDTIVKKEEEFNLWFDEFHNFILFILVSIHNLSDTCEELILIHDNCIDAIVFTIAFLTQFKPENKKFQDKFNALLIKIFKYILIILKNINVEIIPNVVVKNCLVKIFYVYFNKLTPELIAEMEKNDYAGVLNVLKGGVFEEHFFENEKLKKRINLSINSWENYTRIVEQRYSNDQEFETSIVYGFKTSLNALVHKGEIGKILLERDLHYAEHTKGLFKLIMKKYNELFLFKQFWSDKSYFFGGENKHFLKYKVANVLCENYAKPLLKPFIDINNYLPTFLKDKISISFNYNCKIDDYCDFNLENKFKKARKSNKTAFTFKSSTLNYSFILNEILNKVRNNLLKDYNILVKNTLDKRPLKNINVDLRLSNYDNKKIIELKCCLVKLTYHIKGIIRFNLDKKGFVFHAKFTSDPCIINPHLKQLPITEQLCVGSLFEVPPKVSPLKTIVIPYNDIRIILRKTYYYNKSSVVLMTQNNKQYMFNFHNENDRETFIKEIASCDMFKQIINDYIDKSQYHKNYFDKDARLVLGYFNLNWNKKIENSYEISKQNKRLRLNKIIQKWKENKMTNYKFLILLNFLANRSYVDSTQYPVFPWIFNSYNTSDPLDIPMDNVTTKPNIYRDFALPVGMLGTGELSEKRKANILRGFNSLTRDPDETWPYFYGTHYSNPVYLSHYLVRFYPFYSLSLEMHDQNVDSSERLFYSIETTYTNATTQKADVRELIPEFFTCPEMFTNVNNFDFGLSGYSKIHVNDVSTPCYSKPFEFVSKMRRGFESIEVTNNIFKWIDLIFGYKQKGKDGIKANNIFFKSAYFEDLDLTIVNMQSIYAELEFGLVPSQLFPKEIPAKKLRKIKTGNKNECLTLYMNNGNTSIFSLHNIQPDITYVQTSIEEGYEILGFKIVDNFQKILQKRYVGDKNILMEKILHNLEQADSFAAFCDSTDKFSEHSSIFTKITNCDDIIYTFSIFNNNYLYVTSIFIAKKDKSQCLADIIKKNPITKSIPLCKMDTYGDDIKRHYISFSEESTEIILSGFTDRKIIIISIYLNLTEDSLETESQILYSKYFSSPITATCIFNYCNINYLLLGDQNGNLFLLKKQSQFKYILLKIINDHTQEIQYITFNSHINCFATTSKDGFVNFYLVPSFTLLNSFEVTKDSPIDKVFIFHTPLYCFVAFNEQNKSLICHSINIDQVLFEYEPDEEKNLIIKCPVMIEKRNANEYLAFVNEKNEIIVLTIPELNEFKKCSVDFEVCILEYSKESNVLIAVEKGGCSIAYVNIWD